MKKLVVYLFITSILASCGTSKKQDPPGVVSTDTVQQTFFPVTSFLKGQLMLLDSVKVTPLKITVEKGKTDSAWIKMAELKTQLNDFVAFDINETNMLPFFTESKFNDESTEAITFTYTPKGTLPQSISVRHWDIYVTPETGNVKRVYIVRNLVKDGNNYQQQLTWQTDKQARITTILEKPGSSEIVKDTRLIWGF